MKKVDLFVYGNIFFKRDVQAEKNGSVESSVSDTHIDLSDAIIVKGDMIVDDINFGKKIVCCTGDIIKLSEKDILSQQWISVGERLPDENEEVLCMMKSNGAVVSGYIMFSKVKKHLEVATNVDFHFEDDEGYEPTHWMPLPQLNHEKG